MANMLKGCCLCGGVRYELSSPEVMASCHCTRCQRWTGGTGCTVLVVGKDNFQVTSGGDLIKVYKEDGFGDRYFCATCGSSLYGGGGDKLYVQAGTVRDDHGMKPALHIQVAYKLPWDEIPAGVPQFPEYPPGM